MATQTRRPTGDGDNSGSFGTYPTAAYKYLNIDEAVADDNDFFYDIDASAVYHCFTMPNFSCPDGAVFEHLAVVARVSGYPGIQIQLMAKVNGTLYYGGAEYISGPTEYKIKYFTTNPDTSSAWTVADMNGVGSNPLQQFGIYIGPSNWTVNVFQMYVVATYSLPSTDHQSAIWL